MKIKYLKSSFIRFLSIASVMLFLFSCVKDNFDFKKLAKTELDPNLAIPIVNSSMTINDILKQVKSDSLIQVDANNFITLVLKSQYISLMASEIFIVNPPPVNQSIVLSPLEIAALNFIPAGNTYSIGQTDTLSFDIGTVQNPIILDSISFKSGNWGIALNSSISDNVQIQISIPKAKQNGIGFSKAIALNGNGTNTTNINLAGYTFDLTALSPTLNNSILVNYTLTITSSGSPSAGNQIGINQTFSALAFKKMFGFFGTNTLSAKLDTLQFGIFQKSSPIGNFSLANPSLHVTIQNSYGIPLSSTISELSTFNSIGNIAITGSPNPLIIPSPSLAQIGQYASTTFSLSSFPPPGNSNIATAINSRPQYMVYGISATTNPGGNPPGSPPNFVLDTSTIKATMELDLPLYGSANGFSFQDTNNFTFPSLPGQVQSMLLRLNITNGFPINLGVQIYFTDANLKKLDSLVTTPNHIIMPSAVVNSAGIVTSSSNQITDFTFNQARISSLVTNTKKMLIVASLSTPLINNVQSPVKFYSNYSLNVKLGTQAQLKIGQ